ncbi:MAG: zinc finger domain-containing protein [Candidatus Hydrothermarchaeaceae archaeon]
MERVRCISCGAYIQVGSGSVKFECPMCEESIGRCTRCRELGKRFTSKCGFEGP